MPSDTKILKKEFCLENNSTDGKILQIHHTVHCENDELKRLIFLSIVFDNEGKRFACADHHRNVFVFDLQSFTFWRLEEKSTDILAFSPCKRSYLILAKYNIPFEILIVGVENACQKFTACGHRLRAKRASFSTKGDLLITSNENEALIWETRRYTLCYELKIENLLLRLITFTPGTDNIFANFVNNSVQMWNKTTLEQLDERILNDLQDVHYYSFSKDGRCVALALGLQNTISLFNGLNWQCVKKIQLKKLQAEQIKQMAFIDDENEKHSRMIVVHLKDGKVYLLNVEKVYIVELFAGEQPSQYRNIKISPNCKYLACIHFTGEIDVNDVSILLRKLKDKRCLKKSLSVLNDNKEQCGGDQFVEDLNKNAQDSTTVIGRPKLLSILKHFRFYSEKNRFKIWKQLLQIPLNHEAYAKILANPGNTKYLHLEHFLTINNKILLMHFKKILCMVTSLCPVLENVDYLPMQIFPFVKLLHNDPLVCFESIVTILVNFCQMWYNYDSQPPTDILLLIDNLLEENDFQLFQHYKKQGISSSVYAFNIMKTLFSENFHTKEWLQLWDHILSNNPSFILISLVSFNIVNRHTLLKFHRLEEFERFFNARCRMVDMNSYINLCYNLMKNSTNINKYLEKFKPLKRTRFYSEIKL